MSDVTSHRAAKDLADPYALTSLIGTSADAVKSIAALYLRDGDVVADVTYGTGVFWKKVDVARFDFRPTDLLSGVDFRDLPYPRESIDVVVLDPPYTPAHDADVKASISGPYRLNETSPRSIPAIVGLYAQGIVEAARVLVRGGLLIVKCQDVIENHRRHWTHVDVLNVARGLAFEAEDLFVLTQRGFPAMRHQSQKHARANHSYFWVFRRPRRAW